MFSDLIAGTWPLGFYHSGGRKLRRYQARNRPVRRFVIHHAATTSDAALQASFLSNSRTLSATYGMARDGRIFGVVSETFKPNTTSHAVDFEAATIEIVNEGGELGGGNAGSWKISDHQLEQLARLVADVATRHDFPIDRAHVRGHREYVSTRCPGEYLWARLDAVVARAREIAGQDAPAPAPAQPAPDTNDAGLPVEGVKLLQGVGVGDSVRIIDWALFSDAALTAGRRFVTGTYRIVGVTYEARGGIEPSLHLEDANGARGWAHFSAVRGVLEGAPAPSPAKSVDELAAEVLAGKWGNGHERQQRLAVAGYDYAAVQGAVNAKLAGSSSRKSTDVVAREVLAGKWGNGNDRRQRLTSAGYDYAAVQAAVNALL